MTRAFIVFWRGLRHFEKFGWVYVVANIYCALLCIPVITAPAAFAALAYLSHAGMTEPTVHPDYFWTGFRKHWRRGLIMGLANIVIIGIIVSNLRYYALQTGTFFLALRVMWTVTLLLWLSVQMYLWPILEEMDEPRLWPALRNSALMLVNNPGFSITLLVLILIFTGFNLILIVSIPLITMSILACVVNAAVLDRLAIYRARRK